MNCDQCKEEVFELIERETTDPEGVHEILSNCPDCRAEFQEMKAMLAVAQQLPLEAPPDHLDILILQAAEARTAGVAPAVDVLLSEQSAAAAIESRVAVLPQPRLWRQPLAMAAVALLVVGIGITTVSIVKGPSQERLAEAPSVEDEARTTAEPTAVEEAVGGGTPEGVELADPNVGQLAARGADTAEPPAARQARATRTRSPKKKEERAASRKAPAPVAPREEPQRVASADADQAAESPPEQYDAAELPSLKDDDSKSTVSFGQANQKGATTEAERQCASTILMFEKRRKADEKYVPTPQQQLDAGLCYQMLGKRNQAQRWLKRAAEHPSTSARAKKALEQLD